LLVYGQKIRDLPFKSPYLGTIVLKLAKIQKQANDNIYGKLFLKTFNKNFRGLDPYFSFNSPGEFRYKCHNSIIFALIFSELYWLPLFLFFFGNRTLAGEGVILNMLEYF